MQSKSSTETQVFNILRRNGRGWAFSAKDFVQVAERDSIDKALQRLLAKGVIRRVIVGIYDYPINSKLLKMNISPDIDQVAEAIARKFGWTIQVTGVSALNILGISTQISASIVYLSNGPNNEYRVGNQTLEFQHTPLKNSGFKVRESSLLVQGLLSWGENNVDEKIIALIRSKIPPKVRSKILKDTNFVTGRIRTSITKICSEENT